MQMNVKTFVTKYKVWLICLLACIIMPFVNAKFYSSFNIESNLRQMIAYGTVALGLTLGYIAGVINLTIGSMLALAAGVFVQVTGPYGFVAGLLAALLVGALIGIIAALLVNFVGLQNWLVVIAMMIGMKGIAVVVCNFTTIQLNSPFAERISEIYVGPIPVLFFFYIFLVIALELFLRYTNLGRKMYACGGDAAIAGACGINVRKTRTIAFVMSSMLASLGGVLLSMRLLSANGNLGNTTIMDVLPMSIIGGASFSGGKGSSLGTLSGTLSMVLIASTLNLLNVDPNLQNIVKGVILIIIVASDKYFVNKERKV